MSEDSLGSDDEILDWFDEHLPASGPVAVAIDAPLLVPNETGRRPCESELSSAYGARKAGAHSSNRQLLGRYGPIRGETLSGRLDDLGFRSPFDGSDHTLMEVYPHPALIEVFGLEERLRYKAKRGFGVARRREGLGELDRLLAGLTTRTPPLIGQQVTIDDSVRGKALKAVEDKLDARICAWLALLWLTEGPEGFSVFGDRETGHIAVPLPRRGGGPGARLAPPMTRPGS